ncbi:MAG: lytic transglycosylase [Alphaproteobacteria bacterium]|nr:MAG: lytic transglycosylase [Alphaproteobacteria bacterium]
MLALLPLLVLAGPAGQAAARPLAPDKAAGLSEGPLRLDEAQLEPIAWDALEGWAADDHAAAFAAFRASCRPLVRTVPPAGETRPMRFALIQACRRALAAGPLARDEARLFFERHFRPLRVAKLGESTGLLTGYYEPIVEGSRFPTGIFRVPIYRRPHDLVPPPNSTGPGFPNRGQSLRRTANGGLVRYYDRGEILDGALDGRRLEICWIKDHGEALAIQLQGSARIRLEDGVVLRLAYDAHNGHPFVPLSRILVERNLVPRAEISARRIREWLRDNPDRLEEVRRENRSFTFFRIAGLSDEREAVGAQGVPLTPGRSIAVDDALHVYGTPFFIRSDAPAAGTDTLDRLVIAQDTGSAIVGPARADVYWGAGEEAGQIAGRLRQAGSFAMLVPREIDPVVAGARMPLPRERPPVVAEAGVKAKKPAKREARATSEAGPAAAQSGAKAERKLGRRGARSKAPVRTE